MQQSVSVDKGPRCGRETAIADFIRAGTLSTGAGTARARIRRASPAIEGDRPFYRDIAAIADLIERKELEV